MRKGSVFLVVVATNALTALLILSMHQTTTVVPEELPAHRRLGRPRPRARDGGDFYDPIGEFGDPSNTATKKDEHRDFKTQIDSFKQEDQLAEVTEQIVPKNLLEEIDQSLKICVDEEPSFLTQITSHPRCIHWAAAARDALKERHLLIKMLLEAQRNASKALDKSLNHAVKTLNPLDVMAMIESVGLQKHDLDSHAYEAADSEVQKAFRRQRDFSGGTVDKDAEKILGQRIKEFRQNLTEKYQQFEDEQDKKIDDMAKGHGHMSMRDMISTLFSNMGALGKRLGAGAKVEQALMSKTDRMPGTMPHYSPMEQSMKLGMAEEQEEGKSDESFNGF